MAVAYCLPLLSPAREKRRRYLNTDVRNIGCATAGLELCKVFRASDPELESLKWMDEAQLTTREFIQIEAKRSLTFKFLILTESSSHQGTPYPSAGGVSYQIIWWLDDMLNINGGLGEDVYEPIMRLTPKRCQCFSASDSDGHEGIYLSMSYRCLLVTTNRA